MFLRQLCDGLYFPSRPRITDERTRQHYYRAIDHLGSVLGRAPVVADLTDANVVRVMTDCTRRGLSSVTANHRRKCLCALWAWCARQGMLPRWPAVEKMREPRRAPRAWTHEQLLALVDSCRQAAGTIGGIPAANWWLSFHAVCWDTGARTGEVMSLRWDWLEWQTGTLYVPAEARKGKVADGVYVLMPDTLAQLRLIEEPRREVIFDGLGHRSAFWKRYATLLRRAGLPCDRYSKPQKLRRSHASHLARAGGDATQSLGHSSDAVTRASYLDPSICGESPAAKLFRILPDTGRLTQILAMLSVWASELTF